MTRILRIAPIAVLAAAAAACAPITSVPAGPLNLQGGHQVTLGRQWSDVSAILPQRAKKVRVLSIDGPMLNRLYVAEGLGAGEGLLRGASKERPAPTFHTDMGPNELVELTADSLAQLGYQRVATSELRPVKFGGHQGLRFDIEAQTESGLEIKGTASLAVINSKLYLIAYVAPAEHYFRAILPEVETIMGSAT